MIITAMFRGKRRPPVSELKKDEVQLHLGPGCLMISLGGKSLELREQDLELCIKTMRVIDKAYSEKIVRK